MQFAGNISQGANCLSDLFAADASHCQAFSFMAVLETSCVREQGQGVKCVRVPVCACEGRFVCVRSSVARRRKV